MTNNLDELIHSEILLIKDTLNTFIEEKKSIFLTSSFQTHSIPLLHIVSLINEKIPIYFLNTGFHFPKTIQFKKEISAFLDLDITNLESLISKTDQRNLVGMFHFVSNPDYCCYLNKVLPLEPVIAKNDVWISGLRRNQTEFRSKLDKIDSSNPEILKYYPMLEWSESMIERYRELYQLPQHPLHNDTGGSIGCEPCTSFIKSRGIRAGRWEGSSKSECGIHEKKR